MPRTVVLEELHVAVRIPAAVPERRTAAVRRRVRSDAFRRAVERTVLAALGREPPGRIRVVLSR